MVGGGLGRVSIWNMYDKFIHFPIFYQNLGLKGQKVTTDNTALLHHLIIDNDVITDWVTDKFYMDDLALVILLKGCCLRAMGSPLQAEECFLAILKLEKNIVEDTYLIPYSVAELGFLYYSEDKIEEAITWLEAAK